MSPDLLGGAIREAFGLVSALALPLLAAAALAGVVLALTTGALGIRDGALGQMVRTLAVVATLVFLAESLASMMLEFGVRTWTEGLGLDVPDSALDSGSGSEVGSDSDSRSGPASGAGSGRP